MSKNIITKLNNKTLRDIERLHSRSAVHQHPTMGYRSEKKPPKENTYRRPISVQVPKLKKTYEPKPSTSVSYKIPLRPKNAPHEDPTDIPKEKILKLHGVMVYPSSMEIIPSPQTPQRGLTMSAAWLKSLPEHKESRQMLEFIKKRTEEDRERYMRNEKHSASRSSFEEYLKALKSKKMETPKEDVKEEAPIVEGRRPSKSSLTYIVDGVTRGFSSWKALAPSSSPENKPAPKETPIAKQPLTYSSQRGKQEETRKQIAPTQEAKSRRAKKEAKEEEPTSLRPIDLIVLNRKMQEELFRSQADQSGSSFKTNSFETPVLMGMAINKDHTRYRRDYDNVHSFHTAFRT